MCPSCVRARHVQEFLDGRRKQERDAVLKKRLGRYFDMVLWIMLVAFLMFVAGLCFYFLGE
jgi:hypothetical protein